MAFDKSRFIEYVKVDSELIKKLIKHKKELGYAKDRTKRHKKIRDMFVEALQKQPKNKVEEKALIDELDKLETTRMDYSRQTHFLLLADFIEEPAKVLIFFPPPPDEKPKKKRPARGKK